MEARHDTSWLTITPDRITIKVADVHSDLTATWLAASEAIVSGLDFGRSLRGRFSPGPQHVWLTTGSNNVSFLYDFTGMLIQRLDKKKHRT